MSLLNLLTPRNLLSCLHVALGLLIIVCGIISATKDDQCTGDQGQWVFLSLNLLVMGLFTVATQMYGHKLFAQVGFMYTFGGRGVYYVMVTCFLWAAYTGNFSVAVSVMALIMGIINVAVAFFCTGGDIRPIEQPLPFFGPPEFNNIHSRLDPSLTNHTPLSRVVDTESSQSSEVFSLEAK